MTPRPPEPLLTAKQVATLLGVSPSMVYKLHRQGDLRAVRVGSLLRFPTAVVREYTEVTG